MIVLWLEIVLYMCNNLPIQQGWATYGPRAACGPRAILVRPARPAQRKKKALPYYVGRYHLPVKRPLDSLFGTNLTSNDPVFHYSPHPKTFLKIRM